MKLKKLILENFRQFYERQEIDLETSEQSNVIVIHGENGSGKTTILEAFSWCLYGKMDLAHEQNILNEKVFNDLNDGETSDAKVILLFEDRDKEYLVTRVVKVKKVDNQQYHTPSEQIFEIKENGTLIDSPTTAIDKILSHKLKKYFFFDGERIDKLARPESAKEIENGIKNIMGISVLEKSMRHIKEAKKILTKELEKIADEGGDSLYVKKGERETEIDEFKEKLENNKERKNNKISEKGNILQTLKKVEEFEGFVIRREAKEKELEELKEKKKKLIFEEKSQISKKAYLAVSGNLISKITDFLEKKREKGELPSGIREQFIQDLIDEGKCICGRTLLKDDEHIEHLKKLLTKTVKKSIEDGFLNLTAFTKANSNVSSDLKQDLAQIYEHKKETEEKIEKVTAELSEIDQEMKNQPTAGSNSADLMLKLETVESTIENLTEETGQYKGKIKELEEALEAIKREIEKHKTRNRQVKIAENRIKLCEGASDQVETFYENLTSTVRKKLSVKISSVFSSIIIGKNAKISHNFELEITKEVNGEEKNTPTSTGENQIASLAFISSLVNIAKKWDDEGNNKIFTGAGTYPIVMDSPFGTLDNTNRDLISKYVQSLAPQVIVFASSSQWSKEVENNLKPYIQHEYILQYHNPNQEKFKVSQKSIEIDGVSYELSVQDDYEFTKIVRVK